MKGIIYMDSIIFDVDGTLWDSADSVAAAWNLAIKKFSSLDITLDREILGSVFVHGKRERSV